MKGTAVGAGVIAATAIVACSFGLDTEEFSGGTALDGGGGNAGDSSLPDGFNPGGDGSVIDPRDGSSGADAGGGTEGGLNPCEGFRFCDSFDDRTGDLKGQWQNVSTPPGGGGLTTQGALSLPNAARFTVPAQADGAATSPLNEIAVGMFLWPDKREVVELDLKISSPSGAFEGYTSILALGRDLYYSGGIAVVDGGVNFGLWHYDDDPQNGSQAISGVLAYALDTWIHVKIEQTFDAVAGRTIVTIGGNVLFDQTRKTEPATGSSTFAVRIGAQSFGKRPATTVMFDNVRIR